MTVIFLVRHAVHELGSDILAGRMPGVRLSAAGHEQAAKLGARLGRRGITALQTSPRSRTLQTADAIAAVTGLPAETVDAADEVNFGTWTGKPFSELDADPLWTAWNTQRSTASAPGGETISDLRKRITSHIDALSRADPDGRVVIVSHAEVIRTAVLHYLGMPLDAYGRIDIDPASITTLSTGEWGVKLAGLNEREGV